MKANLVLERQMELSGGVARVVDVPARMKPTTKSLKNLEREISSQIGANEAMRGRSMQNASKSYK